MAIRKELSVTGCGAYIISVFAVSCFPAATAQAQIFNPTVLAPSARPPAPSELQTKVERGRRGLVAPRDADKKVVVVRRVTLQGAFPELAEENAEFSRRLQGQRLSVAEIYKIAGELQAVYAKAYPLAILSTKSPGFPNGDVVIAVRDGFIEKLDLSRVPESVRELVRARLEPLVGKRHLTSAEYQRQTLLIGNLAGVSGLTVTEPGEGDGDVLIAQVAENRVSGAFNISNRLPREYGTWEFSKSFALNNALGWGEQLSVAVSSSPDFDRFFSGTSKSEAVSVDGATPLGADGFAFGAGFLEARSHPTPLPNTLGPLLQDGGARNSGLFERTYARVAYPIFLATGYYLKAQASFEHIENHQASPAGLILPSNFFYADIQDRYNALRFVAEGKYLIPWGLGGAVTTNVYYAQGIGGRAGDTAPFIGVPLSRPGASPLFSRLAAKGRLDLNLPEAFRATVIGRGQTSFGQPLMTPENFILDGFEAVSGYAAGTLNVDRGATVRGELTRPFAVQLLGYANSVSPYIFGAYGAGVHERPYIIERKHIWAETFGGGLRADTNFTGTPFGELLSLEFGRDYSNLFFRASGYRTNVNYNMRFAGDPLAIGVLPGSAGAVKKGPPAAPTLALWPGMYAGLNAGYTWDPRPEVATYGLPASAGIDSLYTGGVPVNPLPPPLPPTPGYAIGFGDPGHSSVSALGVIGRSLAAGGGYSGGAQIGYNYQSGRVVAGFETDIQGSNARTRHGKSNAGFANIVTGYFDAPPPGGAFLGASVDSDIGLTTVSHTKNVSWLGTARGRGGYLVTPTFLAFATGGLAYGYAQAHTLVQQSWLGAGPPNSGGGIGDVLQSSGSVGSYSGLRVGWTVGAGLEWMFGPNASVKAEYLHYDLGGTSYALSPLVTMLSGSSVSNVVVAAARTEFRGDVVRIGLNYHLAPSASSFTASSSAAAAPPAAFASGFYAGLNAGYSWDASPSLSTSAAFLPQLFPTLEAAPAASATGVARVAADGVIGGGQAGYNFVMNRYVLGAEADLQGSNQSGRAGFVNAAQGSIADVPIAVWTTAVTQEKTLDWFGSGRIRAGYLITPGLLAYGAAGFAYGGVTAQSEITPTTIGLPGFRAVGSTGHISTTRVGWTAGGGVEWKFSPAMSLKAEYLYWDLGRLDYGAGAVASSMFAAYVNTAALTSSLRFSGQIARIGVNYHFDPTELVAIAPQ